MNAAAEGDRASFGRLAEALQDDLLRLALALGLRRHDAEEAVQEAFCRAWSGRSRWRSGGDPKLWMSGFVVNVAREVRRRRGNGHASLEPELLRSLAGGGESAVQSAERLALLADAVADLPPRQREAVACRYLRQLNVRQTAEVMNCAEGTVKAATAAAMKNLREVLRGMNNE